MRRGRGGNDKGGAENDSREIVVGNGATEDYSVMEDSRLTVIVRGVMRHAILKTDRVLITGRFHGAIEASNLEVARGALFLGKAMVHTATIGGRLEGILVASGTLTMKAAGHCDGVLRYGDLHVQHGGQLTGAVKAASPADASIAEIPVPDLPEGTWDDYHWSSRKKIKKRMMMTMMGGGELPPRGSDGGPKRKAGKRVKGGPRILRSAGKSVIPDGDLARRVAENTARREEVTPASAARSQPAATVEGGGIQSARPDGDLARRVAENTARREEVAPASAARSRPAATVEGGPVVRAGKVGTGARKKSGERVTATSKGPATVMLSESGLPLLPSPSSMQQQPADEKTGKVLVKPMRREGKSGAGVGDKRKDAPREPRERQARRSPGMRTRNAAVTVSGAAAEETKTEGGDVDARGVKNGGSVAKGARRASRGSPTLRRRPSGASKPEEGGRDQPRPPEQADSGMSSTKPGVRADRHGLISQEGAIRLRKVSRRRRGSGRVPARMTSIPRVSSSVAEPGAARTVTPSEGTSTPDQTLVLSSVPPPSTSVSGLAREAVAGEPTLRTQTATGSAARMATTQQTKPVATPVAMSRNAGDDLRLPEALRAAFAAAGSVGDGDEAGQPSPMPESGGIRDVEGEGSAKTDVTTAEAGLHGNKASYEDRSRQVEEAKAVLRSGFALGNSRRTKGVPSHPAERGPRRKHSETAAALAANVDGHGQVGTGASHHSSPDGDSPLGVGSAQIERGGVYRDGGDGDGDGDGVSPRAPSEAAVGDGRSKDNFRGKARAGHGTVERDEKITEKETSGARTSAVSTPVSISTVAAAAAAAAAALEAGDMSLFGGGPAVAGNDAAELPLPSTRGLRLSGSYTEAAVAAVAAAAALKRTESAFRTPSHGKSRVSGGPSQHTPVHDKEMFASPPQELILRDFGGGISAQSERSPPPGPAANAHRRQAAREREMIRGLRVLPATTATSRQSFDRSKLPFSPTTRSRPKPSFQGSERAGWVSMPVQASPVAADAAAEAAKSAAAAATFAKNAAKVAERSTRNKGSDFDWSKVGMFPLVETESTMNEATGAKSSSPVSPLIVARSKNLNAVAMPSSSYPCADVAKTGHLHAPAATSASTTGPPLGGGCDTIQTAPVSPMVAMPMVEGSAREIGREKSAEDSETDRAWMVGLTALTKEDSASGSLLGVAASLPPGGAGVSTAPFSAAPAVAVAPGVANTPSKGYTGEISPSSATAVALGVAVSSAMTTRKRVGCGEGERTRGRTVGGDEGGAQGGILPSARSRSTGAAKTSLKVLMQHEGVEDSGADESGGDACDHRRWRELRDRARECSGIGPASMARARHAARELRSISPAFERSALPTLGQLRRQNPPVSPGSISEMSRSPMLCTPSPSISPRPILPSRVSAPAESRAATTTAVTAPFPERSNEDLGFALAAAIATAKKAHAEREEPEGWNTGTVQEETVIAVLAEERALAAEAVAANKASAARKALAAAKVASAEAEAAAEGRAEKKKPRGSEEPETRPEAARAEVPQEGSDGVSVAREGVDAGMDSDADSAAEADVDKGAWDRLGGSMEESCMVSAMISAEAASPTHDGAYYSEEVNHVTSDSRVSEVVAPEPTLQEPEPTLREPTVREPSVEEPAVQEPSVEELAVQEPTVPEPTLQNPGTDRYHSEIAIPTSPRQFVGDVPVEGELEYGPPFASVVKDAYVGTVAGEATSSGEAPASGDLTGSSDDDAASEAEAVVETAIAQAAVSSGGAEADAKAAEAVAAAAAEAQVDATAAEAAAAGETAVVEAAEAGAIAAKAATAIGEKAVAEAEAAAAQAEIDAIAAEAAAEAAAAEAAAATEAAAAAEAATAVEAAAATKAAAAAQAAAAAGQAAKIEAEGAAAAAAEAAEAASEAEAAAAAATEPVHVDNMVANAAAVPTPTGDTRGAADSFGGSAVGVRVGVVARGPAGFPQTDGPRRSSVGAPSVLGGGRSRNRSGVSMAGKKIEAKDLPRIRSDGGMIRSEGGMGGRKTGALVAGRPTKKQSGFVAPEAVRQGLGPAGAFAGNANWRVDAVREKPSSFANIKADGHGGFHNPMAALRAQQQHQHQNQLQRHPWSGRVAPGSETFAPSGTFTALDASGTATAAPSPEADAPSEKTPADADERLPPMPAWMMNKGLRNTPGVLLGRPRAARGRLHGGGANVGVGVGFLPRPSTTSLPVASERQDEAPKVLPDSVDDGGSGGRRGSSSNGAASTRGVESESDAEKRTEEGTAATASGEDTDGLDDDPAGLSGKCTTVNAPAAPAAADAVRIDPAETLEVTPQVVLGNSWFGSGRVGAGAKVMPSPDTPPAEVVGAEDDASEQFAGGEDSKSDSSEGAGGGGSGTSALKLEAPTVAMELDSGAESGPYGDVEPLEIPSSPGASGGFAALGRFLFGNRPASQREKIAPGEELDLSGKPRQEDFPSPASDSVDRDEVGALLSARSIADGLDQSEVNGVVGSVGGGGVTTGSGRGDSFSTSRSTTSTISGERVGSSSSDCTTAPTSSADGDGDGDDTEHALENAGASAEDAVHLAVTPTLAPASTLVAAPPGVTEWARARSRVRARARAQTYPDEGSTSPFDDVACRPPSVMVELSPAVSNSASDEDGGQAVEVEASGETSTSQALRLEAFSSPSPVETPGGQEVLDVVVTPASLTPAEDPDVSRRFTTAAAGDGNATDGELVTTEEFVSSRAEAGGEEEEVTPSPAMVADEEVHDLNAEEGTPAALATTSTSSRAVGNASLLHAAGRTWPRSGSKAPDVASSVGNGSSGSGGGEGYRPAEVRAASLLSGERKTGLAALEHQGTGSKTARRALLTESKQRRASDVKQKPSIFEILRQRSAGIASFQAEKRESAAAAGRRTLGRSLRTPSPRRPSSSLTAAPALPSPKTSFASSPRSVPPVRSTVGDAIRRVTRRGSRESLRGGGSRGTIFDPLDEVDDDQVEPAGSDDDDDDEEPDYWSKYGVIDPAALEEDAEIEI